jgi:hypothetical protein
MKRTHLILAATLLAFSVGNVIAMPATLPDNTPVNCRLMDALQSGETQKGQAIQFSVTSDVTNENGDILIAKGSRITGKVLQSSGRAMLGIPGKLKIGLDSVKAIDGTEVPLRGNFFFTGRSNVAPVVVTTLLLVWPAVFIHGRDIVVDAGTSFLARVNGDVTVDPARKFGAGAQTTIVQPAPTTPATITPVQ